MKIFQPQAMSEIGKRPNQEDAIFPATGKASTNDRLFVVCDGMGGHEAGEVASNSVSKSFGCFMENANPDTFSTEDFRDALTYAYDQLDELDSEPNSARKMGTTLTFLYLGNSKAIIAHVGDSRVYQLRQDDNGVAVIVHKTEDHSLVNDLVRAKIITPEEAKTHPRRNVITRAMQPNTQERCRATVWETNNVKDGDYFFLCSDGVLESIDDNTLTSIIGTDASDEDKLNTIKELCAQNSKDNNSAYLIHIEEGYAIASADNIIAKETNAAPSPSKNQPIKATPTTTAPSVATVPSVATATRQATSTTTPPMTGAPQSTQHNNTSGERPQTSPTGGGPAKKRPFSAGILAGLAVAAILLLGIGGYLAYSHYSSENKEKVQEQPTTEPKPENPTSSSENETKETKVQTNKTINKVQKNNEQKVVTKPSTPASQQSQQQQALTDLDFQQKENENPKANSDENVIRKATTKLGGLGENAEVDKKESKNNKQKEKNQKSKKSQNNQEESGTDLLKGIGGIGK